MYIYVYEVSLNSYDIKDFCDNGNGEIIFNMDVGVLWFYGLICIGFVVNNLIFCEIKIKMIIFVVLGNFILYLYDMKL